MTKKAIALIGLDISKIDFKNNPNYAHFSHIGADGIKSLLDKDKRDLESLGFDVDFVFADPSDMDLARANLSSSLKSKHWDCVLIGSGVRSIPSNFLLFEVLINLVVEFAPQAKICFNTRPNDSAEAVQRWVEP